MSPVLRCGPALLLGTSLLVAASHPARAQSATVLPAVPPADEIVVTGSRITRPEFAAPSPIVSFDAKAIAESGNTNITNFLERVPALTGSRDFTQTSGGNAVATNPFGEAGLNQLNLRNLGTARTLVLVDGRRHVAGEPSTAAVDINAIPTGLIERVDVLTAGASAVYGADGVSGVVNFILKRDLDGIRASAQQGLSSRSDAANSFASIIAGHNFAGGRGNMTVAFEYNEDDRLENDQRDYLRVDQRQYLIPNDARATNPAAPANILVGNLRYPYESPIGAVFINGGPDYNGLGQLYNHGTPAAYYSVGGDDTPVAGFYSGDLAPKVRRSDVNLFGHYDFSDAFKIGIEGKFAETRATTFDYPFGVYGQQVPLTNPFVPASIAAAALAAGDSFVTVNRDNLDYGRHGESDLRRTYRGVVDLSGRIGAHATYDAYAEYGRTDVDILKLNEIYADRYQAALDVVTDPATGRPACRSGAASGCLPVSLFGPGPIDPRALAYFQTNDLEPRQHHPTRRQRVGQRRFRPPVRACPAAPSNSPLAGNTAVRRAAFQPQRQSDRGRFPARDRGQPGQSVERRFRRARSIRRAERAHPQGPPVREDPLDRCRLPLLALLDGGKHEHLAGERHLRARPRHQLPRFLRKSGARAPNIGELFAPLFGTSQFVGDPCTLKADRQRHALPSSELHCALLAQYPRRDGKPGGPERRAADEATTCSARSRATLASKPKARAPGPRAWFCAPASCPA